MQLMVVCLFNGCKMQGSVYTRSLLQGTNLERVKDDDVLLQLLNHFIGELVPTHHVHVCRACGEKEQ